MPTPKHILTILTILITLHTQAQTEIHPYNKAVIWRGFEHYWTYNHRCNRIGDFVQLKNDVVYAVHTSATGTGPDNTTDTSYYSTVATPDAAFMQGQDTLEILGLKDSLIVVKDTISITMPGWMHNKKEYITLLNGFDLAADNSEAQKIRALYITLTDAAADTLASGQVMLRFIIKAGMVLNCMTPECHICRHAVKYRVTVYYLLAGLEAKKAASSTQLFTTAYSWNKKEEMKEPPLRDFIEGTNDEILQHAVAGIKSFNIVMDKDHWLIQWNNSVTMKYDYNPAIAQIGVSINQMFKDWRKDMRYSHIPGSDAAISFKQRGWEIMNIDAAMLQFKTADIKNHSVNGVMCWPGNGQAADSPNAILVNTRPF